MLGLRTASANLVRTAAARPLANPTALRLLAQRRSLSDDARKKIDNVRTHSPTLGNPPH